MVLKMDKPQYYKNIQIQYTQCPKCKNKNSWAYNLQLCGHCDKERIWNEGLL